MKISTLMALTVLAGAGAAYAQAPGGGGPPASPEVVAARAAMQKACAMDAASLCAGKAAGRETNQCLREAGPKVSPGCADAISKLPAPPPRPAG